MAVNQEQNDENLKAIVPSSYIRSDNVSNQPEINCDEQEGVEQEEDKQ